MVKTIGKEPLPELAPGATSIRFGAAFLRPHRDKGHYELMRPIITVTNEEDRDVAVQHPQPIPIAVYRTKGRGDKVDPSLKSMFGPPLEIKTLGPNNQPLELILVWWPGMDQNDGR